MVNITALTAKATTVVYYFVDFQGHVLDLAGSGTAENTPVIGYPMNSPATNNQLVSTDQVPVLRNLMHSSSGLSMARSWRTTLLLDICHIPVPPVAPINTPKRPSERPRLQILNSSLLPTSVSSRRHLILYMFQA